MIVKLLVVGASDSTGRVVTEKALAAGHTVTAYMAHSDGMTPTRDGLTIVRGDVTDPDALRDAMAGMDAVIFAPDARNRRTTTLFSEGIVNVADAMAAKGVRRVLALSTARLEPTSGMPPIQRLFAIWVLERVMRNIYLDLARMEDELELTDTDWTVIRVRPSDRPTDGKYQVCPAGTGGARYISRSDVADYVLSHVSDWATYQRKLVLSRGSNNRSSTTAWP